jgi:hypothetical protein
MPQKVVRTSVLGHRAPGSDFQSAPRSLVDEALARVYRNKFNRLRPLALNLDTWVNATYADVIETYSTKVVT